MTPTPEAIAKFKKAQAAMKADPSFINDSIAKLSADAQKPAKAIRDIFTNSSEDAADMRAKITAIRAPLSPAILKELDAHRDRVTEKYGLPKCE